MKKFILKNIAFLKSATLYHDDGAKMQDRYVFQINTDGQAALTVCIEYSMANTNGTTFTWPIKPVEKADKQLALYVFGDRMRNKDHEPLIQRAVDTIPYDVYIKGLLEGHEVALYIREKGLK